MLQITQYLLQICLAALQAITQGLAIDKLHCDEMEVVTFANLIDVCNVWMVQRRSGLCFLSEPAHVELIRGQFGGQDFQRYFATELCVFGQVNLTHSARAKLGVDLVAAEFSARLKWRFHEALCSGVEMRELMGTRLRFEIRCCPSSATGFYPR